MMTLITKYREKEKTADNGADKIQAHRMLRIVLHLTRLTPRVSPAPIRVPLSTCVELTGIPQKAENPKMRELAKSPEKP
jgi:hypothetical protein